MRILIIEDQEAFGKTLKLNLEAEAYAVDLENDGERGLYRARMTDYDAIVLDDILPGKHGYEICRELRADGKTAPILLMSVQSEIDKRVSLLNDGADDYLTKPFAYAEMSARLRALLRRSREIKVAELRVDDLFLDEAKSVARRGDFEISLTVKELALLHYLMRNPNRIVSRGTIMEHVWNGEVDEFSNMIETHICNLRRKIDKPGMKKMIHTVSGRGYLLGSRE